MLEEVSRSGEEDGWVEVYRGREHDWWLELALVLAALDIDHWLVEEENYRLLVPAQEVEHAHRSWRSTRLRPKNGRQ